MITLTLRERERAQRERERESYACTGWSSWPEGELMKRKTLSDKI